MQKRHIVLVIAATVLFVNSSFASYAARESDTAEFRGEFTHEVINDTLFLTYHLTPIRFDLDSACLKIWGRYLNTVIIEGSDGSDSNGLVIIYDRRNPVPHSEDSKSVYYKNGKLYLEGTVRMALHGQTLRDWQMSVIGWNTDDDGNLQMVRASEYEVDWRFGAGMEIWSPSFGWYHTDFASPIEKEGLLIGWGLSMGALSQSAEFTVSTSYFGVFDDFAFSEPLRIGYRQFIPKRSNYTPSVSGAIKLTKLKLKEQGIELYDLDWGLDAGVALEGPFERAGYSYSTGHGGYHTVELFIAIESSKYYKGGTRYVFKRAEDTWAFKIALHFEGIDVDAGIGLKRENNRPLIHKALALPGMIPAAILYVPFYLYEKITGKELR